MTTQFLHAYQRRVSALVQIHGTVLWQGGHVDLVDISEITAAATVRDGRTWHVTLYEYDRPVIAHFSCTCKPMGDPAACLHIWAVLLEVDHLNRLAAITGNHHVDDDVRTTRAPQRPQALPPRVESKPDWRRLLQPFANPTAADRSTALPVIEYHVQPGGNADGISMTVQVQTRFRKKNGELGAQRLTKLSSDQRDRLPLADRTLLAMCERDRRATRSSYLYYRHDERNLSLGEAWSVARDTMPAVVPLLAATGRVFVAAPRSSEPSVPLVIDVDEPFRFEVDYVPPTAGQKVGLVRGVLRRGGHLLENVLVGIGLGHQFIFVADRLVRIDCAAAEDLAAELGRHGPFEVPAAEVGEVLGTLARIPGARQFLVTAIAHVPASQPLGVLALLLPVAATAPVAATLQFDYDGTAVMQGDDQVLVTVGAAVHRRDFAAEQKLAEQVLAAGVRTNAVGKYECDRAQVPTLTATLCAAGLRVLAQGKQLRTFKASSGSVRSTLDWLELDGAVQFDGHAANFPELLRRKVTPEGFVELGDGSFGLLPDHWLRRIEALRLLGGAVEGDTVRLANSQALLLDAMLASREGDEFAVDKKFAQLRARLHAFRSVAPTQEPAQFRGELRPYQRQGLGWLGFLRDFGLGGCLADDMGLGKTVQVLAHLASEHAASETGKRRRGARPTLLVAPRSVLPNWLAEAARFAPQLRVLDFSQPDRWQTTPPKQLATFDLVLTTYATVRLDAVKFVEHELRFHYAILDESQAAKNADSQTSKATRLLRAEHRLALTGTPVENHLGELWSLFEFLNPGMLGRLPAFRSLFAGDMTNAAMAQHRDSVQRALRPVLLRRTKAQVLTDLPEKIEQTLWCELEPEQRRRYDELRGHYRDKLLAGGKELGNDQRFFVLEALLRLRQAACHEGLLDPTKRQQPSAKLDVLMPRLEQLAAEGHQSLVFSQFTSFLDLVEPELVQRGIAYERLDGQTRDRAARVDRFQSDPKCAVFLISLKAGGFGLNLTAADYVFVLDPWWNPAAEMQAIDRAHRIGQKRTVHAYRLVCRGTVEERVLELQGQKKALCEAILGNERSLLQDMTRGDLELLLG